MPTGHKRKRAVSTEAVDCINKKHETAPTISKYFAPLPKLAANSSSVANIHLDSSTADSSHAVAVGDPSIPIQADMAAQLDRIARSNLTSFRKRMLSLLCEIPRGRYSTYQALSDHVTATSHKTCARAVGSAMRNNPFAPEVPCHRILAANGSLGGFGGHWGESGKYANKKHELLHEEGIRFDSRGKVKGPVFRDFTG